jgi:ACS family glucarate transporter-like MFS transporter
VSGPIDLEKLNEAEEVRVGPPKGRGRILLLVVIIMAVAALARLDLSIAGKNIQDQFSMSIQTLGFVLGAFFLGYAVFQVPWGYAADRFGPRIVLTAAIVWWSVFTIVLGFAPHLAVGWLTVAWSLAIVRFLVGVGAAAAAPGVNKIAALWMGEDQRALGTSYMSFGTGIGGICTPLLIVWIMQRWSWQTSFYVCGVIGLVAAVACWRYTTDRPEEPPTISAAKLNFIRPGAGHSANPLLEGQPRRRTPWKQMLSSRSVWALLLSYAFQNYVFYVYFDWFFFYLVRSRGLSPTKGGIWTSAPYIAITVLALVGGRVSDLAVQKFGKRRGRQTAIWIAAVCSPVLLVIGAHTRSNFVAIPLLAAAAGFNFFPVPAWWATCIDLMPNFSASLSALMNSFAHLAAWLSPILAAHLITHFGWTRTLDITALITVVPGLIWFLVNADENLEERFRPIAANAQSHQHASASADLDGSN